MTRFNRLLAAVICLCLMLGTAAVGVSAATDTAALSIVSLGDSIARGYGCQPEESYGYKLYEHACSVLGKDYRVSYQNLGTDGDTTADLLHKLQQDDAVRQAVSHADIITLSIGGNDLLGQLRGIQAAVQTNQGMDSLPHALGTVLQIIASVQLAFSQELSDKVFQQYTENLTSILAELGKLAPRSHVLITTIPNPTSDTSIATFVGHYLEPYNTYIANGCGTANKPDNFPPLSVADSAAVFNTYAGDDPLTFACIDWNHPEDLSFDPHPTPAGHHLMAQEHIPLIDRDLEDYKNRVAAANALLLPEPVQDAEKELPFPVTGIAAAGLGALLVLLGLIWWFRYRSIQKRRK